MAKKKEEAATELVGIGDRCMSCNTSVVNDYGAVKFNCPSCGQYRIIRCAQCRKIVTKYKCPNCGFEGPN